MNKAFRTALMMASVFESMYFEADVVNLKHNPKWYKKYSSKKHKSRQKKNKRKR